MGVAGSAAPNITFFEVTYMTLFAKCQCYGRFFNNALCKRHFVDQLHVEYNKEKYRPPYLAVLEAWVLEVSGSKEEGTARAERVMPLDLPPPRYSTDISLTLLFQSSQCVFGASWLVFCILLVVRLCCGFLEPKNTNTTHNTDITCFAVCVK